MSSGSMRAVIVQDTTGSPDDLAIERVTIPAPGPGEILVRVGAAGLNRSDVAQRNGAYPVAAGTPNILGLEVAGIVAATGSNVTRWRVGDRVMALLGGGGYAEYAVVDERHALAIPAGIDFTQAATLPEAMFTVQANVFDLGALSGGETLLVHGAASGVGVMAVQMARAAGARVLATVRGDDRIERLRDLGVDIVIDTDAQDFGGVVKAAGGADVILDMVAGPYFARNLDVLNSDGRLVHIAFLAGETVELPLRTLVFKRLRLTGSTLRARSAEDKAVLGDALARQVMPEVANGTIRAVVDTTFALEAAADAHRKLEEGGHLGNIVLIVDPKLAPTCGQGITNLKTPP